MIDAPKARRPSRAERDDERRLGYVTRVVAAQSFFFVKDEFGDSAYGHATQLLNIELADLKSGQAVTFTVHRAPRGPAASNIVAIF